MAMLREAASWLGAHDSGVTAITGTGCCVTVTVNGSAAPVENVTVPVRGVVASFAATVKVAELPDDEAGETDNQDSEETADHSP
jgi:hypothetical protein